MMPLSFSKFSEVVGWLHLTANINEVWRVMEANRHISSRLNEAFSVYLRTGGFPISILEYMKGGR